MALSIFELCFSSVSRTTNSRCRECQWSRVWATSCSRRESNLLTAFFDLLTFARNYLGLFGFFFPRGISILWLCRVCTVNVSLILSMSCAVKCHGNNNLVMSQYGGQGRQCQSNSTVNENNMKKRDLRHLQGFWRDALMSTFSSYFQSSSASVS